MLDSGWTESSSRIISLCVEGAFEGFDFENAPFSAICLLIVRKEGREERVPNVDRKVAAPRAKIF